MSREVLYVVVPGFYAAVERARDPSLCARPVVVGGNPRKRGVVQSASPDALEAGVEVGMTVIEALSRCPRARQLRTDMKHYREISTRLRAVLRSGAEALEPVGLEGAFLDATSSRESAEELAARIVSLVRDQLGLPVRVGVASVKFLARIAADQLPGEGVARIRPGEELAFLKPLPLGALPGVGPKTISALGEFGAACVGDLIDLDPAAVERVLGNHGLRILELARGTDPSRVRAARLPRTMSRETTFGEVQRDLGVLSAQLQLLARAAEAALQGEGLCARRIAVKIRYADQDAATRSRTLGQPVRAAGRIFEVAEELLRRTQAGTRGVRSLGVVLSGLTSAGVADRQLDLFDV